MRWLPLLPGRELHPLKTPSLPGVPIDLRKSTGWLYARIRRTSGVNHIPLPSHAQPHAVGQLDLYGPGTRRAEPRRGQFVEVKAPRVAASPWAVEVELPNGVRLRVRG